MLRVGGARMAALIVRGADEKRQDFFLSRVL